MIEKVLVVGGGSIGRRHIDCMKILSVPHITVVEPCKESVKILRSAFEEITIFEDIDDALKLKYDAAIIAAPTHKHADITCKIALNKIPMLLEKPIETNLQSAKTICDAVKKAGIICQVAYCLRFDPGLCRIKEILSSGKLGKVYAVDCSVGDFLPEARPGIDYRKIYSAKKENGGGVCIDYSHELDYFRWLFGESKNILASVKKISDIDIETEDIAECILESENEIVGRVHMDYISRTPHRRISIYAADGTIEYDFIKRHIQVFYASQKQTEQFNYEADRNLIYIKQLQHFFDCISKKAESIITPEDAMKTLELALKIRSFMKCI